LWDEGKIKLPQLYSGIDAVFYRNQGVAEYDFIVAPYADAAQIRIAFNEAEVVELTQAGDILVRKAALIVEHRRPVAYQDVGGKRTSVACRYLLAADKTMSLEVGDYDRSAILVIDPVLTSRFVLAGRGEESLMITGVATDANGFSYITGQTDWPDFAVTPGLMSQYHTNPPGTVTDVFVMKLAPVTNAVVWSVLVGGSIGQSAAGIAVDSEGNVYVGGSTLSPDFPVTSPPSNGHVPGSQDPDMFVFEINPQATALVYSVTIGGSGYEIAYALAVAPDQHVALVGTTASMDFPVTKNAVQGALSFPNPPASNNNAAVVRLNSSGVIDYATYLGGQGNNSATGVAFDSTGDIYVAGLAGTFFPTLATSFAPQAEGGGFVSRLDHTSGQFVYSTYIPGVSTDDIFESPSLSIQVDSSQNAYVAGPATLVFPTTQGAFQTDVRNGARTAFLLELNPSGTQLVFSTLIGGSSDEMAMGVALTGNSVTIAGMTDSADFPANDFSMPVCNVNSIPAEGFIPYSTFVASFDHTGKLIVASEYGECTNEMAAGVAFGSQGLLVGATYENDLASFLAVIDVAAANPVQAGIVVDAASYQILPGCPLELISIFGQGLGPETGVEATESNGYFPTTLAGTQVLWNGAPSPLLYVSATQINSVVPGNLLAQKFANLSVTSQAGTSAGYQTYLMPSNPTIFTDTQTGVGQGAILNQDGSVNSAANPAARGSIIQIFGTGGGQTTPSFGDGQLVPEATSINAVPFFVTIAGESAPIKYEGSAPSLVNGVLQVNVQVPMDINPSPIVPILLWVYPYQSASGVTVAIK
jgi:uncharacterized protein (TIGR03437 family)